ncbi:unnamed protein product [Prunus brigantina]
MASSSTLDLPSISHVISVRLERDNYPTWLAQIVPVLRSRRLLSYVDGSCPSPSPTISDPKAKESESSPPSLISNPDYEDWVQKDQLVLSLINGSLHHKVLATVATKTTARDTWLALETRFASPNQNRLLQLRSDLLRTTRGDSSITDFLDRIHSITDNLALAGAPVHDSDLLAVVMNNVGPLYENTVAAAQAREKPIGMPDLEALLLSAERRLQASSSPAISSGATAMVASRGGRGGRGGRGFGDRSGFAGRASDRMTAHHLSHGGAQQWVADTGANTHITNDLSHLSLAREYHGSDNVGGVLGGTGLPITHIGHSRISHLNSSFSLNNILHCPDASLPLLSVHKFATDNNCFFTFFPDCFFIQDLATGKILFRGKSSNGLYPFSFYPNESFQILPDRVALIGANKLKEWRLAMADEFNALLRAGTWILVPRTPAMNVLPNKWIFRVKRNSDGTIQRYKARLVANGFHQQPGLDYGETFSPVVNHSTIRLILALSVQFSWPVRQLDVQNAFLHGYLDEERVNMHEAKPVPTPALSGRRLSISDGDPLPDPTEYRSTVGALQYLTLTRPDIAFAVNQVCQFMHQPTTAHWLAVKRILRYLNGTLTHGLFYSPSTLFLSAFSDADYAGNPDDRRSTGGYCVYLGTNLISWSSKKQRGVSRSSTEAEYRQLAYTAATLSWFRALFQDLHLPAPCPKLWCDNISALSLASNPVFHSRTRHVEIADIFTKGLSSARFSLLRSKLPVPHRPVSLRGCNGR